MPKAHECLPSAMCTLVYTSNLLLCLVLGYVLSIVWRLCPLTAKNSGKSHREEFSEEPEKAESRLFRPVSVSVVSFGSDQCSTHTIFFLLSSSVFFFFIVADRLRSGSEVNLFLIPKVKKNKTTSELSLTAGVYSSRACRIRPAAVCWLTLTGSLIQNTSVCPSTQVC